MSLLSLRPARTRAVLAAGVVAAALVSPGVTMSPSYAGIACDTVPVPGDDCTAPTTSISTHPDAETTATTAAFTFAVTSTELLGVSFECRLEGPGQTPTWVDCTDAGQAPTTGAASYTDLGVGSYVFSVRATDKALGTPNVESPAKTFAWQVVTGDPGDPGAPDTTITSPPPRWLLTPFVQVDYEGDEPLVSAECKLNGVDKSCSGVNVVITGMGPGDDTLTVAGTDADGDTDPTPAVAEWTLPYRLRALALSDGWKKKSGNGYYQGDYAVTSKKGQTVKHRSGSFRSAVLVATKCPGCGKVAVTLGSTKLKTIDLDAPATKKRQAIPIGSWAQAKSGTLTVTTLTNGKNVVVEGLGFSHRP